MAVIEIAKIQVRRGQEQQTGIPQLAGGEFAWAEDTENLYIGLKREDGGARDANIRVLTENDYRLFTNFVTNSALPMQAPYTWNVDEAPTITSSSTYDARYIRPIQQKLDDFVSVADFGIVSSTSTQGIDWTTTLQRVIDHLFLDKNTVNPINPGIGGDWDGIGSKQYNKKLYLPAGLYQIGGTIFIPKGTVLVGEGIDKTIIENISTGSGIFQTVDIFSRRGNPNLGKFDANTGTASQTITQGDGQPSNVHIEGMTLRYSTSTVTNPSHLSLVSLDCVDGGVIRNVKFQGVTAAQRSAGYTPPQSCTGVDLRGFGVVTSENIVIDHCQFNGLYYDIRSNYDTNHVIIKNNIFKYSTYAVALSTTTNLLATYGPRYYRIENNKFESIDNQGVYVGGNSNGAPTNHVSQNNAFTLVGNHGFGENGNDGTSIIKFVTSGNASINDYFERQTYNNKNFNGNFNYYPLVEGKATIDLLSVTTATLLANTSTTIMRLPITGDAQYLNIKYQCNGTNVNKAGNLQIYIRPGTTPSNVQIFDDFNTSISDGGISWGLVVEPAYKYYQLFGVNPLLSTTVQLELQTKLML